VEKEKICGKRMEKFFSTTKSEAITLLVPMEKKPIDNEMRKEDCLS
jgi:hypothetical protein